MCTIALLLFRRRTCGQIKALLSARLQKYFT
jgi:hypothetical protein